MSASPRTRRGRPTACGAPSKITDRRHAAEITDNSTVVATALRRRRAASWRCAPLRNGLRDPLDRLYGHRRCRRCRRRHRRPAVSFVYVDAHGNMRDERGGVLVSALDVALDGDDGPPVPEPRQAPEDQVNGVQGPLRGCRR